MKTFFSILGLILSISMVGQNLFPDPGPIYGDEVVPRIDISLPADSLAVIFTPGNEESDYHFRATFQFDNGTIQETIDNVGFRLRGNTSRHSRKKSFKVSFNTYEPGRKWYGIEKLNLNGEHNDPSVSRSKMCWDLLRSIGVPAPRANHIQLYINGSYFGIYANIEHIDEEFVGTRFGNKDGNLYKCLWPADLNYLGDNPDLYKFTNGNRRTYELKTNEEKDDYSDLAHFIDVLNNEPIEDFRCKLESIFNIHSFLPALAFDILSGNWDGPLYNKNNFYLYHNEFTGLFEYIPYDLDNTFGIDWFGINWTQRNIYEWGHPTEPRPLFWRILEVSEYRDWLSFYMNKIINTNYTYSVLYTNAERLQDLIRPYVISDPYYPRDYGFSIQDFDESFNSGLPYNHTPFGLKDFISLRRSSANQQLELNEIPAIIHDVNTNYSENSEDIFISVSTEDDQDNLDVRLCYQWPFMSIPECIIMYDDGNHHDVDSEDGIYGVKLPSNGESGTLEYYIEVLDSDGHISVDPVCNRHTLDIISSSSVTLAINEFMASNDTSISDEYGEFDDWVEIYNYGTDPVSLSGRYLSDISDNPTKWAFSDTIIHPDKYLLIWADDDEEQGPLHTSFKLSAGGEFIGIFDSDEDDNALIDGIEFGPQETDQSFGRIPNGTGDFQILHPTPGYANESISTVISQEELSFIRFYPNPTRGYIFLDSEIQSPGHNKISITNIYGQIIQSHLFEGQEFLDINAYPQGMYFLYSESNGKRMPLGKIIKR